MNTFFSFIAFICCSCFASAQLVFEQESIDFGDLSAETNRFIDVPFKNVGKQKVYILSFRKPAELVALTKGDLILPDSSNVLRLQVNPKKKGKFDYELQIFTSNSNEALRIRVKGNLKEFPADMAQYQACPDFNKKPPTSTPANKLTIYTFDAETKTPLQCSIFLIQNGIDVQQVQTKKGSWSDQYPLGPLYVFAQHPDYVSVDTFTYVNAMRNEIRIPLKKKKIEPVIIAKKDSLLELEKGTIQKSDKDKLERAFSFEVKQVIKDSTLAAVPLNDFDTSLFKPVNVVFVLDISASMASYEKVDLMKYSLNQLLSILRPCDKITLVSFSTNSQVLLPTTDGASKETVQRVLKNINASGGTSGLKGIEKGVSLAKNAAIKDGKTIVILISDGAFGAEHKACKEAVMQAHAEGIDVSVVGIKILPKDEYAMKEVAQAGNGAYVRISKLSEAQHLLIQEIKRKAMR